MHGTITGLAQVAINVHDVERGVAFYRDVVGLHFLFQPGPQLAFFDCNGVRIMLSVASEPQFDHPSSILYFRVDDIHASWDALTRGGADPMSEPHFVAQFGSVDVWMAFFRDPDRNVMAITSEVPRAV